MLPNGHRLVEFVGPSGVGKTFLYRSIENQLSRDWVLEFTTNASDSPLNSQKNSSHQLLWNIKRRLVEQDKPPPPQRRELLRYFLWILDRDNQIQALKSGAGFFFDEGIVHNFAIEICMLNDLNATSFFSNRAIVYLRPENLEITVGRIRERERRGGHVVVTHQGLSDEQLLEKTREKISALDLLVSRGKNLGLKVLEVPAELATRNQQRRVLRFQNQLLGRSVLPEI